MVVWVSAAIECTWNFPTPLFTLQFKNDCIPDWYLLRAKWKDKFKKQTPASCVNIYFKTIYKRAVSIAIYELNMKRQ